MNIISEIKLIDSHAHLLPPWFSEEKIKGVVSRAVSKGVIGVVNSSSEPKTHDFAIKVSKRYSNVKVAIGLQPTIASKKNFEIMRKVIEENKDLIVAIGEVGLDYHWVKNEEERKEQRKIFAQIIEYANSVDLPLVIHSRKAESDCLDLLDNSNVRVYLHSFEGNKKEIERAVDNGYYIGVTTAVGCRKNWRKTAQRTPLKNLLLETDSPFMPFKPDINPNEPMWVREAAEFIAKLKGISIEEIALQTTKNAETLFNTSF